MKLVGGGGGSGVDMEPWNRSSMATEQNWMAVTGLRSGTTYEVRVVAVTDARHETRSRTRGIMIGSIPGRTTCVNIASLSSSRLRYGSVVTTSVFDWRTFPDLHLIYG